MQKIAIIGTSGSGKTTLGQSLARKLEIPRVDLDDLSWEPNWVSVPHDEFDRRLGEALAMPHWVMSGNYRRVQPFYLERADTLIWLDYSFRIVLGRIVKRTFRRIVKREVCCNGNYESLALTLSRDSILLWVFKTYKGRRRDSLALMAPEQFPHLRKIRFRSPRETQKWLDSL